MKWLLEKELTMNPNNNEVEVNEKSCVASETKDQDRVPVAASRVNDESLVREYYEAESWQFSGCGD